MDSQEGKTMKAVRFKNRNMDVAAHLYFPEDFDASRLVEIGM